MSEDDGFTPAVNRLSCDLALLNDGIGSCRSVVNKLDATHRDLDNKLELVMQEITARRSQLSQIQYKLHDYQICLGEIHKRQTAAIDEGVELQRTIDSLNEAISSVRASGHSQLSSLETQVAALSCQFEKHASVHDQCVDSIQCETSTKQAVAEAQKTVDSLSLRLNSQLHSGQVVADSVKQMCLSESQQCLDTLKKSLSV